MWLKYGISPDDSLVEIDGVRKGKTDLKCPYCGGLLTAKKGQVKKHHFAHTAETCRAVAGDRDINLPLFERFNLHLSPKEFEALQSFWKGRSISRTFLNILDIRELVQWNEFKGRSGGYELTKLGKIPVGQLSLLLFNQIQEPLILEKLSKLEESVEDAAEIDLPDLLTDLRLYRAQLRRILSSTLYYLKITADDETFYKIGVTTRSVEERIHEIESDLQSYFQSISIELLGTWAHRGNIEGYFLYRYKEYHYPIGRLTEYFKFSPEVAKSALRDLRRMKPKILSPVEVDILEGKPSAIELKIEQERKQEERSAAIRLGMERAKHWGKHIGRPKGRTKSDEEYLAQPICARIVVALQEGLSVRKVASLLSISPTTVQKVKTIWLNEV